MTDIGLLSNTSLIAIAAILLIGVPHGGLDGAVARRAGWPSGTVPWILFHLTYLLLAAAVVGLWWLYPLPSLVFFLLISALHFGSSDIRHISPPFTRAAWLPLLAHGGLVAIAIPAFQSSAVEPLFAVLVGADNSVWLLKLIDQLLLPWAACLFFYLIYAAYQPRWQRALCNLSLLIALAYLLPPLVSFALYFCLWHSRSHMQRIWKGIAQDQRRRSAIETLIYSLLSYAAAALFFVLHSDAAETSAPSLVQLTFIGLAALTVPHMFLVDFIYAQREEPQAPGTA
ncbi:MAG: Brp/Blh family beta-carotene 15,15'-dioxygenase [Porticoccaceae bacterium]